MRRATSILFVWLLATLAALGVILEWDAVTTKQDGTPADNLAGYRAYYGNASRNYSADVDVGNFTSVTLPTLPGITYYAVTAYDEDGLESDFSDEVSYTADVPQPPTGLTATEL